MNPNNTQIVEGCRRGDRKAQKALYDTYAPMAMGVCMRFSHDRDSAQDLLQDGFVRVYEKIGLLKEPERLGAWIYRTMVNVCLRHYQKHHKTPVECDESADDAIPPLDPFETERIVWAIQQLTPAQRMAFNMVEVEGYSYSEVAEMMKCSEVNVRVLICHAKSNLRKILTTN